MNLRKALDKAKEERQKESSAKSPHLPLEVSARSKNEAHQASPLHLQSRQVTLDPKIIKKNRIVCLSPDSRENDLYKGIRTQIIKRMSDDQSRTLMITSALPGEGKTMTSINLAITFAKDKNHSVLLVDGDLRRQQINKQLGYPSEGGLVDYLVDDKPLQELIVWPGVEKLSIISGGRTVEDSTELLSSFKMQDLMSEIKGRYDNRYILLESPPILSCPDTAAFSPLVDAIVMVVESGRTTIEEIKKAMKLIPAEKFLGFILNKNKGYGLDEYKYYYGS
jgi:non-specific protein-tyrosine kinase